MALATIGPRTGGASILINAVEYKTVLTNQRFEYNTNQDDSTVFGDEPNPKFEEGASIGRVAFAGLMTKGAAESSPPLPLPQAAPVTMVFGTGAQLAFTANFSRLVLERTAMNRGVLAFEAVITSAITKTWTVA